MKPQKGLVLGAITALVVLIAILNAAFTVSETEQAIVLQFGAVKRIEHDAGLKFKLPFLQNVVVYDKRLLDIVSPPEEVILADQIRLVVDAFAIYRIDDPLRFYQAVRTNEGAKLRLASAINATLRDVLGTTQLSTILSKDREGVMSAIRDRVNGAAAPLGIVVTDVRISSANLPDSISASIYNRMTSERQREATEYRAQGFEQGQAIKSAADHERTVILATAKQQADVLHGEGDAKAIQIYADAYGKDPDFYAFYRSLEAYRTSLADGTTFVLTPNADFLRYLSKPNPTK